MARTTVDATVQRIRRQLSSGYRFENNYLAGAISSSDTTLSLQLAVPAGLQPGALVFVGVEAMRVTAVSSSSSTITVVRGVYDSTAAAHSVDDEIVINPRFSPLDIIDAMIEEIGSYGPQLYRVDDLEFTVEEVQDLVEFPASWADAYGVIDVRRKWTDSGTDAWPRVGCRFQRGASNWDTTSGNSVLRFIDTVQEGIVYVQVARPFVVSAFTLATDLVTDVFLPESMLDVVAMGTKMRLLVDNENGRTARTAQDEPRRAEETPVGATISPLQFNNAVYRNRKQEEINKLRAMWPVRYS